MPRRPPYLVSCRRQEKARLALKKHLQLSSLHHNTVQIVDVDELVASAVVVIENVELDQDWESEPEPKRQAVTMASSASGSEDRVACEGAVTLPRRHRKPSRPSYRTDLAAILFSLAGPAVRALIDASSSVWFVRCHPESISGVSL